MTDNFRFEQLAAHFFLLPSITHGHELSDINYPLLATECSGYGKN